MPPYSRIPTSEDEDRLPHGLTRIGYDADTQIYTYTDEATGQVFEGQSGNRYGVINPTNRYLTSTRQTNETGHRRKFTDLDMDTDTDNQRSADWRYLAPFLLIIGLYLLLLFKFVFRNDGSSNGTSGSEHEICPDGFTAYVIHKGDTCWKVAEEKGVKVGELIDGNGGEVDCDRLVIGGTICIPGYGT